MLEGSDNYNKVCCLTRFVSVLLRVGSGLALDRSHPAIEAVPPFNYTLRSSFICSLQNMYIPHSWETAWRTSRACRTSSRSVITL
jgi:hypothetical protein